MTEIYFTKISFVSVDTLLKVGMGVVSLREDDKLSMYEMQVPHL